MAESKNGDSGSAAPEYKGKVNLVSSEGDKFEVETKVAAMSELVKTMLKEDDEDDSDGEDADDQAIPLPNVKSTVLAKVVEFCIYHTNNGYVSRALVVRLFLFSSFFLLLSFFSFLLLCVCVCACASFLFAFFLLRPSTFGWVLRAWQAALPPSFPTARPPPPPPSPPFLSEAFFVHVSAPSGVDNTE
jgi:hypothetical protein